MQQQNSDEIVREKVAELLGRLPKDTPEGRQKLYDQLRALFEKRYPQHRASLEAVIAGIERDKAPTKGESMTTVTPPAKSGNNRTPLIMGIVLAAAVAAGAGWYFIKQRGSVQDFDRGLAGYASNVETLEQVPPQAANYTALDVDGDRVVEFRGQSAIFAIGPVAVDPAKRYIVKARIRVIEDDPARGGAEFSVGVATFDAEGKLQTTAPGTHRYAAAAARILKKDDGWVDLEGEITGTGNKSYNQFREGTKTVRLTAFFNYRSPKAVSQITLLSFEESKAK